MSQLRKSASFRSRIPVRRTRVPHRRCSSPEPTSSYTKPRQSSKHNNLWYDRRYSSSSYSSSDESHESEEPFQVNLYQKKRTLKDVYRKNDTFTDLNSFQLSLT